VLTPPCAVRCHVVSDVTETGVSERNVHVRMPVNNATIERDDEMNGSIAV
jgi:hypothetical protein